jgi:hypothetical protein
VKRKPRPLAKCKLCGLEKLLCDSHLLPSALYGFFRSQGRDPVVVSSKVVRRSSRQTTTFLLCEECEDKLNHGGETWLIPLLATIDEKFPLYDMISRVPPDFDELEIKAYALSRNPEIPFEKIVHFAAGMFWKASVHSWEAGKIEPLIDLGPYGEALRAYLMAEAPFPAAMALGVLIVPSPVKMISAHLPMELPKSTFRKYCMYVPGIDFRLFVGKTIPAELKRTCIQHNVLHPIVVSADTQIDIAKSMVEALSERRQSRKLAEWFRDT